MPEFPRLATRDGVEVVPIPFEESGDAFPCSPANDQLPSRLFTGKALAEFCRRFAQRQGRPAMTREDYVRSYAKENGLSDEWAYALGIIEVKGQTLIALPCGCWAHDCPGWTMVTPDHVNAHLEIFAPKNIREVFRATIDKLEKSEA